MVWFQNLSKPITKIERVLNQGYLAPQFEAKLLSYAMQSLKRVKIQLYYSTYINYNTNIIVFQRENNTEKLIKAISYYYLLLIQRNKFRILIK